MFNLFASFLIWAIRGWCNWRGRVRVIRRPPGPWASGVVVKRNGELLGQPYLIRYALFGWLPGDKTQRRWLNLPQIYLHHILLPDADPALHNHPWPWAVSLILRGVYEEDRNAWHASYRFKAGDLNRLKADTFHRIDSVSDGGCWTLFITSGGKRQRWGFAVPGQGFVPHRERNLAAEHPAIARYMKMGMSRAAAKELSFAERHPPTGLK